jgi:hypothetical protein
MDGAHVHFDTTSTNEQSFTENGFSSASAMTSPIILGTKDDHGPRISSNNRTSPSSESKRPIAHNEEGQRVEPELCAPFEREGSPESDMKSNKGAEYEKVGDQGVCKMHKFSLYETATRYYLVGGDVMDKRFRILKIDRTADNRNLSLFEDEIVYTKKEMTQLLNTVDDGNKSNGGMKLRCSTWGLLGFIRFTGAYYMLLITKRSQIAMLGGHFVYQIGGTELIPLASGSSSRFKPDSKHSEESRFLSILNNLDLTRSFYFSYSYDITHTLQHNICVERAAMTQGLAYPHLQDYNSMFVWNSYLLQPATASLKNTFDWCLPIIHGYIDQAGGSKYLGVGITLTSYSSFNLWAHCVYHNNREKI